MRGVSFIKLIAIVALVFSTAKDVYADEKFYYAPTDEVYIISSSDSTNSLSACPLAIGDIKLSSYRLAIPHQLTLEKKDTSTSFYDQAYPGYCCVILTTSRLRLASSSNSDYLKFIYPFHHFW